MIQIFQPSLGPDELEAVGKVFASNWVGRGSVTDQFEAAFAQAISAPRALVRSVSCCTEGLFQAIPLLGVGPGDDVVLPAISFVGAANAIAAHGARPVFCDVDPRTLNATPESIERALTSETKAVLLLHYGGVPCEMDAICGLLSARRITLIEDSACSVASRYRGTACGTFGDIGVWSFDAMKILVAGDGGMVWCRDPELARRLAAQLYLGLVDPSGVTNTKPTRWWEFDVSCFGRRAIMNDIASAIGLEQLKKLSASIARRQQIHETYDRAFAGVDWLRCPPAIPAGRTSSYYLYWLQMEPEQRDRLAPSLREQGIYTTFRYYPLHQVKRYGAQGALPNAEAAAETTLCIPLHHGLSDSDVERVIDAVIRFGRRYG